MKPTIRFPLVFGALLVVVAVQCVHSAALYHLPTSTRPASKYLTSVRGGGLFGGKAAATTRSPPSSFLDSIASAAGEKAVDTGVPTQMTYGFVAGWCSGMALQRVGQVAATVLGIGFVTLQTLQYYGYIEISHDKFKTTLENALDHNKDGKVDRSDLQRSFDKLLGVLTYNMPSGAGFVGGFLGGIRA